MCVRPVILVFLAVIHSGLVARGQEPTREELARSLEERFLALGPLTADFRFETIDKFGKTEETGSCRLHVRLDEGWVYFTVREIKVDGKADETLAHWELPGVMTIWSPGGEGKSLDESTFIRRSLRHEYEVRREASAVFDSIRERLVEWEEQQRRMRPALRIDLQPEPGAPRGSSFRISMGYSMVDRATWIEELRKAPDAAVTVGPEEVVIRDADLRRTVVIDRATGFLRSLRLESDKFPTRRMRVVKVEGGAPRPALPLTDKIEIKRAPLDSVPGRIADDMMRGLPGLCDMLRREGKVTGAADQVEALRAYVAGLAVRYEGLRRESAHRTYTAALLKRIRDEGHRLETLEKDLEESSRILKAQLEKAEGDSKERIAGLVPEFKAALLQAVGDDDAAKALSARIEEAFEPARLDQARKRIRPPGEETLLRDEIAEVHAERLSPALFALRRGDERARELEERLAALGAVAFRLNLETRDSAAAPLSRFEVDIHFRPTEGFGVASWFRLEGGERKPVLTLVAEGDGRTMTWGPGKEPERQDQRASAEAGLRTMWNWRSSLHRLWGRPVEQEKFEAFFAARRPYYRVELQTTLKPKFLATLKFGQFSRPGGGASWLDEVRDSLKFTTPEEGVGRIEGTGQTTDVDLKTGLPRSVRAAFPSGEQATMVVSDVKPGGPKPEIAFPDRFLDRRAPAENQAPDTAEFLQAQLVKEGVRVLGRWTEFETPEGTERLRQFLATAAGLQDLTWRERYRLAMARELVKLAGQKGMEFDDMEKRVEGLAKSLERELERTRDKREERIASELEKVKTQLLEGWLRIPAPAAAHRKLGELMEECFAIERAAKSRPERPEPDWKTIVLAAIVEARIKESK